MSLDHRSAGAPRGAGPGRPPAVDVLLTAALLITAWTLGAGIRRRADRTRRLTAQAVAAERVRIARDLHDVVAHHLSVISLQAGVAEYVLNQDPRSAKDAVATVAASSRAALDDMRQLLDVLREEDDSHPGLDGLHGLVDRTRRAGLTVDFTMTGESGSVPAGLSLCAYRVVQESLTNVLRHAGPTTARVEVVIGDRMLTATVEDDGGTTGPVAGSPSGYGIRGMRERAALYGGTLTAGPSGTGFTVRLTVPLDAPDGAVR
ncbi:sensor histidine kinase [Actinoplanes derwentensis]|uniref:histidine kinase n=1 Tax=Actinoplanes derwentensis TaxID=113562 RepID=A0A1H2CJ34_9ACTN|nr:sensor histidine kinase [Actinoplanes derwentensis]GID88709.1 hypothetical protein Ade03nite_76330 [Actinoplanes derwentensis]SDT70066.1 Histidine kinase [Actinoplanes derwentensis]